MIALGGTGTCPLVFGRDGLTDDPKAVFGLTDSCPPLPAWLASSGEVARRVDAKEHDDLPPHVWHRIADLLRQVGRLSSGEPLDLRGWTHLTHALVAGRDLVRLLPDPGRRFIALPVLPPPSRTAWPTGPVRHVLDAVGVRLADLLSDPSWTDPSAVAGEVTDLLDALEDYAASADAWLRMTGSGGAAPRSAASTRTALGVRARPKGTTTR